MMNGEKPFQPTAADFTPVRAIDPHHRLVRPPGSWRRDVWRRFRANRAALFSLWLLASLLFLTVAGPLLWTLDPAKQDLEHLSQPPGLPDTALVVASVPSWTGDPLPETGEEPETYAEDLAAPAALTVKGTATTRGVRLIWPPVAGARGYFIYRNEFPPGNREELGLPLGETAPGHIGYEDRLKLESIPYHYSVVASDGIDEADRYVTLTITPQRAISLEKARLLEADARAGQRVTLGFHPLGSDHLGRDMLARLLHGARISLFIGIAAPLLATLIGLFYGGLAAILGGWLDDWLMRFADFVVALPFLLFMILLRIAFGITSGESGVFPLLVALVLLGWPGPARLVRGQVLQIRQAGYVQAATLMGAGRYYLLTRHFLPNVLGVVLVSVTFAVPSAIFTEAFLSFIGMGVVPPTPSWGAMCQEGLQTMQAHPHELLLPTACISLTVLAFNLLGDGLRDALDAKGGEGRP